MNSAEKQVWLRIRLSVAAWAYENYNLSVMPDAEFDRLCLQVDPAIRTGNDLLDDFFRDNFDPSTGSWVWGHPERDKLDALITKYHMAQK